MGLKLFQNAEPVHNGHHQIEEDHIRRDLRHALERFLSVLGCPYVKPEVSKFLLQQIEVERLVVDQEDLGWLFFDICGDP
jgi:hypothetical protein